MRRQTLGGFETVLYCVRNADADGARFPNEVVSEFVAGGQVTDLGLTLPWAFRLRIEPRVGAPCNADHVVEEPERLLVARGRYVELTELRPLALMQWVYRSDCT